MSKHEQKACPRCSILFECKVGDIANCQCSNISLSVATQDFLQTTSYADCLCAACLAELDQLVAYSQQHAFPSQPSMMEEGVHYYYEGAYFVFTELYHLQRGYCCHNNCRHCAYGSKKQA